MGSSTKTTNYLKGINKDFNFLNIGKHSFVSIKKIEINQLIANQEYIDKDVLKIKIKGKQLTIPYVLNYNNKLILIDGHHTVIAKKINGQKFIMCKFLKRNV